MYPTPNCIWVCDKCGHEAFGHKDESDAVFNLIIDILTCPKCKTVMRKRPPMRTPPQDDGPFKKY